METDVLTDLLDELARDAPTGGVPPGQLWRRGRRVARTRRLGTVAIAALACLLLIALGSVTWQRQHADVGPATDSETGASYLPSRFHEPSPHLPGTDSVGPPGPLIATIATPRKGWFGNSDGLVGVSAQTGAYAFLDLPHAAIPYLGEAALAPDGRHVAYWTTGEVRNPIHTVEGRTINGYAVYDTVTGEVVTQSPRTERGIGHGTLIWFDPTHLGVEFGQMQDCCSSTKPQSMIFDLTSARTLAIGHRLAGLDVASTTGDGAVVVEGERSVVIEADGSISPAVIPSPGPRINGSQPVAVSPNLERVAGIFGGSAPARINVKNLGDDGEGDAVPGDYLGVISWLDETQVTALRSGGDGTRVDLVSVDVRTASANVLSTSVDTARLAINLLGSPVKDQPVPARPWSPWVPAIAAGTTVAVAILTILAWRRRAGA